MFNSPKNRRFYAGYTMRFFVHVMREMAPKLNRKFVLVDINDNGVYFDLDEYQFTLLWEEQENKSVCFLTPLGQLGVRHIPPPIEIRFTLHVLRDNNYEEIVVDSPDAKECLISAFILLANEEIYDQLDGINFTAL